MDCKSSSDSEKTNGNNNITGLEASEEEFGQVIRDDDCNALNKQSELAVEIHQHCSEAMFSQATPEFDEISKNVNTLPSNFSTKSSDVTHVTPPVELIILESESDSTSDKGSVIVISDSGDLTKSDSATKCVRRKSSDMSPVPFKKTCLEETRQSESSTNIDTASPHSCEIPKALTPVRNTPITVRSSPRNSPKRNYNLQPARRLMRSTSADVDVDNSVKTISPSSKSLEGRNSKLSLRHKRALSVDVKQSSDDVCMEIMSQDELGGYLGSQSTLSQVRRLDSDDVLSGRKNPINPIIEESQKDISELRLEDSQNLISADSQNIQLFLSPSLDTPNVLSGDENEPLLSQDLSDNTDNSDKVVLLSESNHVSLSNGIHKSTDQESTVSVDLDSPYNIEMPENPHLKSKPYLSNGYSSSTPENAPFTQDVLLKKTFHLSDSETDNTPPFSNFNKKPSDDSKMSISSKSNCSGIRNNSSNSSLNNGHSNGSHISNSTVPTFHIQMYGDENDDFLSMFIVKTNHEIGTQTLREYQRLSKRLSIDAYAGDVSKSTSPSSVTSGGLLQLPMHPRSSFMSTNSSSSTSSSRTSDGAFIIPQRPKRNLSFHTPTTVKGWQALKQSITDIVSNLADADPTEDSVRSPVNGECKVQQIHLNDTDKPATNDVSVVKNTTNDCHRTTPKSSKKKAQTRTKRVLSGKIKKTDLSVTNEEPQELTESISSPEMIPTDKCEQFQTPSRLKSNDESSSSAKSTPRGRKPKNGSAALNLSTIRENLHSVQNQEQTYPRGTLVLAKWRDKKYYSGKVVSSIDNNKYEIEFYDGQVKTLLDDFIIFGNTTELPLKGQSVYTKVDDVTYEPSLVLAVEKTETGKVLYKCTTDRDSLVAVSASDIYLTEDQAKSFHESNPPKSPHTTPSTPRRRINRDLDLNNIIHEPRSARLRDKGTPKGSLSSPASPKAGTSTTRRGGGAPQRRLESESSEGGDSRASSAALEDVDGIQPEMATTPRRTKGITKVTYSQIKGSSKQKPGKESKVKFETEEELAETLGPIPAEGSTFFSGLHFLLTCIDIPISSDTNQSGTISNDNDSCTDTSGKEDEMLLARIPFTKKRLEEQLERGGGKVYSRFEDIPKSKYSSCRLIVPRPCLTGKFIMCLAANIKALYHLWVIQSCKDKKLADYDSYTLPTGYSIERERMISLHERSTPRPFKDKLILICSDNNNFTKFWDRVCSLAGANTKIITENDMDLRNSLTIVTESNCPTKIRNKAEYENVSLVSTTWVVQCLIEGKLLSTSKNIRYKFDYIDN